MIIGLVIVGCTSPLLTLSTLWQKKEWRIDRLKEHLRAEGFFRQLFGILRPIIVLGAILTNVSWGIIALAAVSVIQISLRRQRLPVWTLKTIVLVSTSLGITIATALLLPIATVYIALPLFQSIPLLISWVLFLPVDYTLKNHVMNQATKIRSTYENLTFVGITGSVGKTTTKEIIDHVMKDKNVLCTPAYVNSEMGVAKWLLKELPKHNTDEKLILIVEMGAYRIGEIANLCKIVKPSIGVITYIGTQHIALFGSQEKLQKAKGELFAALPSDGHAIFNADSSLCRVVGQKLDCSTTSIGTASPCDVLAQDIEETGDGIHFSIEGQKYNVPLHGTHNITNVLLAISVAELLEVQKSDIIKSLKTFKPPSSTFSVQKKRGVTLLNDTHNASPESFRAAIAWAKSQPANNKILLTPGLIELGNTEDNIHRELGTQASGIFSRVIFTGKHGIDAFAKGYTGEVERLHKQTTPILSEDLLLCVGRVSGAVINRILP